MKAVSIHAFGGSEVATDKEVAKPEPADHEVLLKVTSTGMHAGIPWRLEKEGIVPCQFPSGVKRQGGWKPSGLG